MRIRWKSGWVTVVAAFVAALVAVAAVVMSFVAMRDVLVVHAQSAQSGDAAQITPNKVEFENDQIKVIRGFLAPHQKTAVHSHPYRFGVTLTKNDLVITSPDGKSVPSKKNAQEIFWSEPVTHQVENVSNERMENVEIEFKKDKGAGAEVKKDWGASSAKGTAEDPVAVEQEPHHRVIFENQYVRILDVVVKPGETTLFHKHSIDNIPIILTDADNRTQFAGKDWGPTPAKAKSVGFILGAEKPYVHRINNQGSTVFHVIDVEVLP
jgi:quercetin dioxygenase-like cupin family protein